MIGNSIITSAIKTENGKGAQLKVWYAMAGWDGSRCQPSGGGARQSGGESG